ncbi:hypothetical protein PHYSODRAFT_294775 [Phytophthora sojae]|uniref:Uncharacterized protein n=1 Tax=Phytophthora sojae (strain P6497) TaxID=1094619 RepID=G4YL20_PHYSP|nr:hypothetical protein PHYSODRAFT_294775 [Phytophthora sojae]EGZ29775.1 hypothetical protein PHYSODRAFT_294775 [Phytophthora sojae]|eukprot:XP_009517050.1 hypothetical protein PHYSODRAFT_294775 [Phytophthora sojae]
MANIFHVNLSTLHQNEHILIFFVKAYLYEARLSDLKMSTVSLGSEASSQWNVSAQRILTARGPHFVFSVGPNNSTQRTMQFLAQLVVLTGLVSGGLANGSCSGPAARTTPPKGAIVVDATGKHPGSYKTVSEGVAEIPSTAAEHTLFMFLGSTNRHQCS